MALIGYAAEEGKLAIPVLGPMLLAGDTHDRGSQMLLVVEGLAAADDEHERQHLAVDD